VVALGAAAIGSAALVAEPGQLLQYGGPLSIERCVKSSDLWCQAVILANHPWPEDVDPWPNPVEFSGSTVDDAAPLGPKR
jgi:hypothetical protein